MLHELGLVVAKADDNDVTCWCPQHVARTGKEDSHPSWAVNRWTGLHNCFSCGYKGNFVSLVADQLFKGSDHFAAARWIRQFGLDLDSARDLPEFGASQVYETIATIEPMNEARLALYTPPPDKALRKRGVSAAACAHFGVLWDPEDGAWILPIRTEEGDLIGWQSKSERRFRNVPTGVPKASAVFGLQQLEVGSVGVLVESPLDALRIWDVGYDGGLSGYGASVSDVQMRLVKDRTDTLIVALDNDRDGRKYSEILRAGEWSAGKQVRQKWSGLFGMSFYNYGESESKDPGEQEDDEIVYGIEHAESSVTKRFEEFRVSRRAEGLPARGSSKDARPRKGAARLPPRRRQNSHYVVRHRGAAR